MVTPTAERTTADGTTLETEPAPPGQGGPGGALRRDVGAPQGRHPHA